jgi:hypothetical protein
MTVLLTRDDLKAALEDGASALKYRAERLVDFYDTEGVQAQIKSFRFNAAMLTALAADTKQIGTGPILSDAFWDEWERITAA